jgi:serine/threonine-protein kinase
MHALMPQSYAPGTVVLGRYVIDSLLGQGGMGSVYAAHHTELARKRFAVKTLRADLFGIGGLDGRFRREADVLAALNHPGIVSIVDYGFDDRTPVMVMEYLEGETLRDRIAREGALPAAEVVRIVREVAAALDYTHRFTPPIVHRDLKPENLFLVRPDGRVKVLDFGIAKVVAEPSQEQNLTQTRTSLGTPQYMSPEQLKNAKVVDATADVFTLASIAFESLTARLAFPGEGIGGVVLAIFDGARPRACDFRKDIGPAVDEVLSRAWTIDRTLRYQSAGEFAQAFITAMGDVSAHPKPLSVPPHEAVAPTVLPVTRIGGPAPAIGALPQPSLHAPSSATAAPIPSHGSRAPLIIGIAVALIAIGSGVAYTVLHTSDPPAPSPTPQVLPRPQTTVSTAEPVLGNAHSDPVHEAPTQQQPSSPPPRPATHPSAPSPFDAVRSGLEQPIRDCATGYSGHRIDVQIRWNGGLGFPEQVSISAEPAPSNDMRGCIGRAIAQYGRIPPQGSASVSRRFSFNLR